VWPGIHLAHNSAKLKILQSAETYPVVKVLGLAATTGSCDPVSSDPLVGGSIPTDQRSDVGPDTKQELDLAEPL
jgi:hypothetical protein